MLVSYDSENMGRPYNESVFDLRDVLYGISDDTYNVIRNLYKDQPLNTTLHEILVGCHVWNLARSLPHSTYSIDMRGGYYPSGVWALYHEDGPNMPPSQPWPVYGRNGSVLGPFKDGRREVQKDVFNNERCQWWAEEGFERVEADAKAAMRSPKFKTDFFERHVRQVESGGVRGRDEL